MVKSCGIKFLAVCFLLAALPVQAAEEKIVSKYTSTARSQSISFEESEAEDGPGFHGLFRGLGGYQLEYLSGDARSWLNLRFDQQTIDLYLPTMKAAGGAFPHKANDVVEWRGTETGGRFKPYAIIYRITTSDDETRKTKTRLLVIKLAGEHSAVVGSAEGANEEAEAKQLADRAK
ncbi:MAG: hypothetical protein ABI883_00180 [Chthoniobacterales bacterium]